MVVIPEELLPTVKTSPKERQKKFKGSTSRKLKKYIFLPTNVADTQKKQTGNIQS